MKQQTALKIIDLNKKLYDQIAEDFSASRAKLWPEFEYFKGYLKNGQDILDLGCGNGRLVELLNEYKMNYTGLDYSQKIIEQAKKKYPNQKFIVADALDLSLLNQKFDIVFCVALLHHIPSKKLRLQVMQNIKTVLKPGGKLLMTNWNLWQKRYIKYIIKYTLLKLAEPAKVVIDDIKAIDLDLQDTFIPWQKKYKRYVHGYTELNMARLVKKSGLEIIKNVSNTRNLITIAIKPK